MNYNGQRKVSLSVSKQNKHLMDTVDDYGTGLKKEQPKPKPETEGPPNDCRSDL